MRACRRPLFGLLGLWSLGLLAPAGAYGTVGGLAAPAGPRPGGVEYGGAVGHPKGVRPVASVFRVAPHVVVVGGRTPRIAIRVTQPGVRSVRARVVFWPLHGNGRVLRLDLGNVRVGRLVHPRWPADAQLAAGRYVVRLHAVDPWGKTLLRRASASGRAALTVKGRRRPKPVPAPAPPPAPAPAPAPVVAPPVTPVTPVTPTAPVVAGGVFPVAGPHTFGGADARFGAGREGHIHEGQDVLAAEGTPVLAPVGGAIVARDYQASAAGFYLAMDTVDGRSFFFAHCQKDTFAVSLGQSVVAGQQLCRVGHTGDATGPHLHFEIWLGGWRRSKDSRPVDPLPQLQAWDH